MRVRNCTALVNQNQAAAALRLGAHGGKRLLGGRLQRRRHTGLVQPQREARQSDFDDRLTVPGCTASTARIVCVAAAADERRVADTPNALGCNSTGASGGRDIPWEWARVGK